MLGSGLALASEPALVERALENMEAVTVEEWAFTETSVQNGTTVVKRHDPTRPHGERWTLVSVDSRPPTDEEREEHLRENEREDKSQADDAGEEDDGEIRAMISPDSLSLLEETATHLVYRFDPVAEDEDESKMYEHVDATLRVSKEGPFVESLEMRSRKPFRIAFGVKLKEFATVLTFAQVGSERAVLPETVSIRMAGRAFLVKKIDETVEVTYSDYQRPGG
jgi:hypothetical protein